MFLLQSKKEGKCQCHVIRMGVGARGRKVMDVANLLNARDENKEDLARY